MSPLHIPMEFPKKSRPSDHEPPAPDPWPLIQDAGRHGWGATFVAAATLHNSPSVKKFDRSHPVIIVPYANQRKIERIVLRAQSKTASSLPESLLLEEQGEDYREA